MIDVIDSIISPETTGQPIPAVVMQAQALLAYSAGNSWPTYRPYVKARPDLAKKGWIVSTTLTANASARCYDIERGGGSNGNIGVFMRNGDRTHGKLILYTFASNGQQMLDAAASFGHRQDMGDGHGDFYYLSAHANGIKHTCGPNAYGPGRSCGYPQANGTQWLFAPDFDRSVFEDYMLPGAVIPDTAHYGWFDTVDRDLGRGRHGSEVGIVREYDNKRRHPLLYPRRLHRLRDDMSILAGQIEGRMAEDNDPDGLKFHRKWRRDELTGRAGGRRYV